MKLLVECFEERAESPRPDYALIDLSVAAAQILQKCYDVYLEVRKTSPELSEMKWRADLLGVRFYDVGGDSDSLPEIKGCMVMEDDFIAPPDYEEVAVESVFIEIWGNEEIVFGGLMKGAVYNHFHTAYIPLALIAAIVAGGKA